MKTFLFILIIFVSSCSKKKDGAHNILKIGLIAPITGKLSSHGKSTLNSANYFINNQNRKGGIKVGGKLFKLQLVIKDSKDDVEVAKKSIEELKNDGAIAVIGPLLSRTAIPAGEVAEKLKIVLISPWSTSPATTLNKAYVFRAAISDKTQGKAIAQFAIEKGYKKAGVLFDEISDYNRVLAEIFAQEFKIGGGKVVSYESYKTDDESYTLQIKKIIKSKPDFIFLPNYAYEITKQVDEARKLGFRKDFLGSDTWYSIKPGNRIKLEGMYFSSAWFPDIAGKKTQQFKNEYRRIYSDQPDDIAALTFDSLGILVKAILKANSVNSQDLKDIISTISYDGVTGKKKYNGTGDPSGNHIFLQIKQGEHVFHQFFQIK